jgi:hypothetical protein
VVTVFTRIADAVATMLRLNFYPWNKWVEYRPVIIEAKKLVNDGLAVTPTEAIPGCGKVICVETPPFLCDYAIIKSGTVEGFTAALQWYLNGQQDPRVITMAKMLTNIIGAEVKELDYERIDTTTQHVNPEPETVVEHRPRETNRDSSRTLW